MHFTRRRDPAACSAQIRIEGFEGKPCKELRVLGLWLDPKLTYQPHIQKVTDKANSLLYSASRILQSTWGLSFRNTRLLYTAIVRPVLTYGGIIWSQPEPDKLAASSLLTPVERVQNASLRRITGAYKAASIPSLEKEAFIPPIDLHLQSQRLSHVAKMDPMVWNFLACRMDDTWQRCALLGGRDFPLPPGRREAIWGKYSEARCTYEQAQAHARAIARRTVPTVVDSGDTPRHPLLCPPPPQPTEVEMIAMDLARMQKQRQEGNPFRPRQRKNARSQGQQDRNRRQRPSHNIQAATPASAKQVAQSLEFTAWSEQ